jgi:hypothetical protein
VSCVLRARERARAAGAPPLTSPRPHSAQTVPMSAALAVDAEWCLLNRAGPDAVNARFRVQVRN